MRLGGSVLDRLAGRGKLIYVHTCSWLGRCKSSQRLVRPTEEREFDEIDSATNQF